MEPATLFISFIIVWTALMWGLSALVIQWKLYPELGFTRRLLCFMLNFFLFPIAITLFAWKLDFGMYSVDVHDPHDAIKPKKDKTLYS